MGRLFLEPLQHTRISLLCSHMWMRSAFDRGISPVICKYKCKLSYSTKVAGKKSLTSLVTFPLSSCLWKFYSLTRSLVRFSTMMPNGDFRNMSFPPHLVVSILYTWHHYYKEKLLLLLIHPFMYISMNSWMFILFSRQYLFLSLLTDAQIVPDLASGNPFRLAFIFFWHISIILWTLLSSTHTKIFEAYLILLQPQPQNQGYFQRVLGFFSFVCFSLFFFFWQRLVFSSGFKQ